MNRRTRNSLESAFTLSFFALTLVSCQSTNKVCTVPDIHKEERCFNEVGGYSAISRVLRIQQDYLSEEGVFYSNLDELKEDIHRRDRRIHDNFISNFGQLPYGYDMESIEDGSLIANQTIMWAVPKEENLRSHVGILAIDQNRFFAYCSSDLPSQQALGKPNLVEDTSSGNIAIVCPEGSSRIYSQGI